MPRIKICGIREPASALVAAEAGADFLGLVFVETSPRFVTLPQARLVLQNLPKHIQPVGLFADHPLEYVKQVTQTLDLNWVQLHGSESPEYVRQLADLSVIKAMPFDPAHASAMLQPWRKSTAPANVQGILLDAPHGGSGQTFDWAALAKYLSEPVRHDLPPLFLAGGLTPENVHRAIEIVRPDVVDVSSGVESQRGIKDPAKIKAFCAAVRGHTPQGT